MYEIQNIEVTYEHIYQELSWPTVNRQHIYQELSRPTVNRQVVTKRIITLQKRRLQINSCFSIFVMRLVNLGFMSCGSYIEQVKVNPGIYIKPDTYCWIVHWLITLVGNTLSFPYMHTNQHLKQHNCTKCTAKYNNPLLLSLNEQKIPQHLQQYSFALHKNREPTQMSTFASVLSLWRGFGGLSPPNKAPSPPKLKQETL